MKTQDILILAGAAALFFLTKNSGGSGTDASSALGGLISGPAGANKSQGQSGPAPSVSIQAAQSPNISTAAPSSTLPSGGFNLGITPNQVVIPNTSPGTSPSPVVFLTAAQTSALYDTSNPAVARYTGGPVAGYAGFVPFVPSSGGGTATAAPTASSGGHGTWIGTPLGR